jgi:hypothetical protein
VNKNKLYRLISPLIVLMISAPAMAISVTSWSTPQNLSEWQSFSEGVYPILRMGSDGTQVVVWRAEGYPAGVQSSVWGAFRQAGGEWTAAEEIFGLTDNLFYPYAEVTPDGTAWVLWGMKDASQPGDNVQVKVAHRSAGDSWQVEVISDWESYIRSIDLYMSRDGYLVATWVACAGWDYTQGPCDVRLRRLYPDSGTWEPIDYSVDATVYGIDDAYSLVAPEGLVVTTWTQVNPTDSNQWGLMSRSYDSASDTWESSPINVSGYFTSQYELTMAQPVMGLDGLVVTTWVKHDAVDTTKYSLYSSTRSAVTGTWSSPTIISGSQSVSLFMVPKLVIGENGITLALWVQKKELILDEYAVHANVREPGSIWGFPVRVSDWRKSVYVHDAEVWPDGTAMLLWWLEDGNRDSNQNETIYWSLRPPNANWGDGGQGQLGNWYDWVLGSNLVRDEDGNAVVIWGVGDASLPLHERSSLLAATRPPGGSWGAPETVSSGYKYVRTSEDSLVARAEGLAAVWSVTRDDSDPDAVFYAELLPDNTPPTAAFTVDRETGTVGDSFQFNAAGCTDIEDSSSVLEVHWDWQDDGTYDTSWSTIKTAVHQFSTASMYTVRLQVRDTGGMTNSTTKQITVATNGTTWSKYLYLPMTVR